MQRVPLIDAIHNSVIIRTGCKGVEVFLLVPLLMLLLLPDLDSSVLPSAARLRTINIHSRVGGHDDDDNNIIKGMRIDYYISVYR